MPRMQSMDGDLEMQDVGDSGKQAKGGELVEPLITQKKDLTPGQAILGLLLEKKILHSMLIAVPFSFVARYAGWPEYVVFSLAFIALIPLAGLLGDFTEKIADHTSSVIGALLNCTFGNATEVILSVQALRKGDEVLVQLAMLGSVLGNMLLVLGTAFLAAGIKHVRNETSYNKKAGNTYGSLLLITTTALMVPTMMDLLKDEPAYDGLWLSRCVSIALLISYGGYLVFQLKTHKAYFDDETEGDGDGDDDDEDEPKMPIWLSVIGLAVVSVLVSFCSDFLVDSALPTAKSFKLSYLFLAVIVIPIVANVAEHSSAIVMAVKGKTDVAIGIALGSSLQIAMMVTPLMVIISWMMGGQMDLNFHFFSIGVTFLSVLVVKTSLADGKSNWFEGSLLLLIYFVVACAFFLIPLETLV